MTVSRAQPLASRHPRLYAAILRAVPYAARAAVWGALALAAALSLVALGLACRLVWALVSCGWRV